MKGIDSSAWLAIIVTILIACAGGVSSAMAWFRGSKRRIYDRIVEVEQSMNQYEDIRAAQATQLAVLQACQENIHARLDEIKEDIKSSAQDGAHQVNRQLAHVLSEIQKMKS